MLVNNVKVYGLEESIRRAKFPMSTDINELNTDLTPGIEKLAQTPKGSGHDNWLNGVIVQFDLTFSLKAWTELQRYHFIDFISSQSTMHRITKFNLDEAYNDALEEFNKGNYSIAKEILTNIIIKEDSADAYYLIGKILYEQDDKLGALSFVKKAISIDPVHEDANEFLLELKH